MLVTEASADALKSQRINAIIIVSWEEPPTRAFHVTNRAVALAQIRPCDHFVIY